MKLQGISLVFAAGLLAACGGGSGGGSGGSTPVATTPLLTITADNAAQTTGRTVTAVDDAFDAGGSALNFGGAIGARVEPSTAAAELALALATQARDFAVAATDSVAVGVIVTETQACSGGGSVEVSIDTAGLSQEAFSNAVQQGFIPPGTGVSMRFSDCLQPGQPTLNGGLGIVFQQFATNGEIGLDDFTLEFGVTFDALTTTAGMIDGDMSFLLVSSAGVTTIEVGGDAIAFAAGADAVALLDYLASATQDNVALVQNLTFNLEVTGLGRVSVTTVEPWTTDNLAEYPTSGVLRIVGANNTSIVVTALDEVNVQLDVDTDGDGVANLMIVTTWVELQNA